ncbi:hypothetical protein PRK78_006050 [Emydomyces testavorans]|uniref:Syntaxin n=1 Tax=Emydomyces testavorans TaxID=2070801 RepID=A0AAF0DLU0_9EURO|nr:hypothetical protein PRK78_006050 [Emydomyces testavorans]
MSNTSKPYTIYNVAIRLPLRSFSIQKRYSDFTSLHSSLIEQTTLPPPAPLPPKSWISKTTTNPTLLEERRQGLETYLRAINESEDPQWRDSSAWRTFLNLPSAALSHTPSRASSLHAAITGPGAAPITDPITWLDCHRDVKAHLHDARLHLTRRDQASTPQKQHECSAQAKSSLVKVGTMIAALDEGLKNLGDASGWGGAKLGEGERRRRKDLLASAQKEKEGLENLLNAMAAKSKLDSAVATIQDKQALMGSSGGGQGKPKVGGRILGKETEQTRPLENEGVLQLQKQIMEDQDVGVEELRKIVARQKELGIAINNELEVQNAMLNIVDEDVERVGRKIQIGRKRADKIS